MHGFARLVRKTCGHFPSQMFKRIPERAHPRTMAGRTFDRSGKERRSRQACGNQSAVFERDCHGEWPVFLPATGHQAGPHGIAGASGCLVKARHVAGKRVNFEIHLVARLCLAPSRDSLGVRDEIHAEARAIDLVHRQ